jgi:hypothetical protein
LARAISFRWDVLHTNQPTVERTTGSDRLLRAANKLPTCDPDEVCAPVVSVTSEHSAPLVKAWATDKGEEGNSEQRLVENDSPSSNGSGAQSSEHRINDVQSKWNVVVGSEGFLTPSA